MNKKKSINFSLRQYGLLIALIAIGIFFQIITKGALLTPLNITNILLQNSYIIILAIGMLFIIITGDFDLSVGYAAGFIGAFAGLLCVVNNLPVLLTIIICIVVGLILGAWQGWLIAYMKIPAFVTTLGNMLVFRGLMLKSLGSQTIGPFPESFSAISAKFIPDVTVGGLKIVTLLIGAVAAIVFILVSIISRRKSAKYGLSGNVGAFVAKLVIVTVVVMLFALILSKHEGIPLVMLLLALLIGAYSFMGNKTTLGRRIYATGGNEKATQLSGINTKKIRFFVFTNMGFLSAIAGIVYAARLNYATPGAGSGFEMDAIASCFIGGASSKGGVGTIFGTIVGALVMGVLNNGMQLLGLGTDSQQMVKGLVLIFAVLLDVISKSKAKS